MKVIRIIIWILGLLNLLFLIEAVIGYSTGYRALLLNDPGYKWFSPYVLWIIFGTAALLLFMAFRFLFYAYRNKRITIKKAVFFTLVILFIPAYLVIGGFYYIITESFEADVLKATSYASSTQQREVVFKEVTSLSTQDYRELQAYEKSGIFQRPAANLSPSEAYERLNGALREKFHQPSQIEIIWSDDEKSLKWILHPESSSIEGKVEFR